MKELNVALLIDSDNICADLIDKIIAEEDKYGRVFIKRMYGDWSKNRLNKWMEKSSKYSIYPVMASNDVPGKNSSDICLVIDAMDILYSRNIDVFFIVSSDSDFSQLAKRLRESSKVVIGLGESKTPESFRASCEEFIDIEKIKNKVDENITDFISYEKSKESINEKNYDMDEINDIKILKRIIIHIFSEKKVNVINIGELKKELIKYIPALNTLIKRNGPKKFSDFLKKKTDILEVNSNHAKLNKHAYSLD